MIKKIKTNHAFTIVELLVVIVVIGILAAVTIVSYSGITNRAITASIKSQLTEDSKVLKMYYIDHGLYPSTLDSNYCPATPEADTRHCLKNMDDATLTYSGTNNSFTLTIEKNNISYDITETGDIAQSAPAAASAESFVVAWGGINYDYANSVTQTSDGGYIITGQTSNFGAVVRDAILAKYDQAGNLSWSRTWGGTDFDYAKTVAQTSDGGYIITGSVSNYGAGSADAFSAKYDQAGNLSWNKTWGGAGYENSCFIMQTSDGGYISTGYTDSFGVGNSDAFLAKYDQAGNLSWNKTWGGAGWDGVYSMIQTSDGGYIIAGSTDSFGAGDGDAFLAKFDQAGNLSWDRTWGGAARDYANSIAQTSDGGYIIAGRTKSYGAGSEDAFLAKYDSLGNLSWSRTWGGAGYDETYSIAQTSDGGYIIAGETESYGAGDADAFLAKYDSLGNLSWSRTWGGAGYGSVYSVIQASDDGYVLAGGTNDYGAGNADALLIKYKSDGSMDNCFSPMCQSPTATVTSPSAAETNPSATEMNPTATVTSPSVTVSSPIATNTVIVAPL